MYKGIKNLLTKSSKSSENNKESTSFDSTDPRYRITTEKIDRLIEKISDSGKFGETEKKNLTQALYNKSRNDGSRTSPLQITERFTPKLEKFNPGSLKSETGILENQNYTKLQPVPSTISGYPSSKTYDNFDYNNFHSFSFSNNPTNLLPNTNPNADINNISTTKPNNNIENGFDGTIDIEKLTNLVDIESLTQPDIGGYNDVHANPLNIQTPTSTQENDFLNDPDISQILNQMSGGFDFSQMDSNEFDETFFENSINFTYRDLEGIGISSDAGSEVYSNASQASFSSVFGCDSPATSIRSFSGINGFNMLSVDNPQYPYNSISKISSLSNIDVSSKPTLKGSSFMSNYARSSSQSLNTKDHASNVHLFHSNKLRVGSTPDPELITQSEKIKAEGLKLDILGIPSENAKSRVETQIKITLRLLDANNKPVKFWSHLLLPELSVSRDKFKHKLNKGFEHSHAMPATDQHVLRLETRLISSSDISHEVKVCINCIRREYKRSLRRKDYRNLKGVNNELSTNLNSPYISSVDDTGSETRSDKPVLTGIMENDWDEKRLALESQRSIIFNCFDLLDFSKGEVVLPTRIICYCRHHNEKVGFCIVFSIKDYKGDTLASVVSPPIMITDDHKSNKLKVDRKVLGKFDYNREGIKLKQQKESIINEGDKRLNNLVRMSPSLMAIGSGGGPHGLTEVPPLSNELSTFSRPTSSIFSHSRNVSTDATNLVSKMSLNSDSDKLNMRDAVSNVRRMSTFGEPNTGAIGQGMELFALGSVSNNNLMSEIRFGNITSVSPQNGPIAGGLVIQIIGSGFDLDSCVYFNETAASCINVFSNTHIECVLPPGIKPGPVSVVVAPVNQVLSNDRLQKLRFIEATRNSPNFFYIEDTDQQLLILVLHIISLRGKILDRSQTMSIISKLLKNNNFLTNLNDDQCWERLLSSNSDINSLIKMDPSSAGGQIFASQLNALRISSSLRDLAGMETRIVNILSQLYNVGELDIVRLSCQHPLSLRSILHYSSLMGMQKLIEFMTACGANVDEIDRSGYSPLHFACCFGRFQMASFLLSVGASVDLKTHSGTDSLYLAAKNGYQEIVQLIMKYNEHKIMNQIPLLHGQQTTFPLISLSNSNSPNVLAFTGLSTNSPITPIYTPNQSGTKGGGFDYSLTESQMDF
ncbi:hypothetical protein BB558_005307 [Smittium angustum]|uniref:Uncharacterized protein n=1 Tax=Smittium angustum TaxID=133377 RepID=A0A2U1J0X7_SMIAN|nr:hypothetical protein BB558_005307 [Smittium angustum]